MIKSILLTGDDGYKSIGTRLLVKILKDSYDLKIAGTQGQQSSVGGKISRPTGGGTYGTDTVDGVEAFYVDGTPADAVLAGKSYYAKNFDLVISGVNYGANLGICEPSGTLGAAFRAVSVQAAPKSIAFSLDVSDDLYFAEHDGEFPEALLTYPGEVIKKLIDLITENDFWGASVVNVNFPLKKTKQAMLTKPAIELAFLYYAYGIKLDTENKRFVYQRTTPVPLDGEKTLDVSALQAGIIAITPLFPDFAKLELITQQLGKVFEL